MLFMAHSQNISVSSFKLMENDLTANLQGSMERDYNGEVAALIKVVSSESGFTFDGGMTGIVKTKQEVGEIWVWVPHGIKRITVRHPELGVLRDYYFPMSIEKAHTYEMILTTGKVQTMVSNSIKKQFVTFNVSPSDATLEFNGEKLSLDASGYTETSVPFGKYNYRVMHPNYHTSAGVVEVTEKSSKAIINVNLEPNFAIVELVANPNTEIWVNGELKGVGKWVGPMGLGDYQIETKQVSHIPATEIIRIMDTNARSVQLKLPTPLYSSIEITSIPSRAKVYIDNVEMGETPLILNEVLVGMREIVIEKEGIGRQVRNIQVDYGVSSSLKVDMTATEEALPTRPESQSSVEEFAQKQNYSTTMTLSDIRREPTTTKDYTHNTSNSDFHYSNQAPMKGITPNMKYKDLKKLYNYRDYSAKLGGRHKPVMSGVASWYIPGLGECINGEWGRGVTKLLLSAGCITTTMTADVEIGLPALVGQIGITIWSIIDATRIAKVKNMYERDLLKLHSYDVQFYPSVNYTTIGNSGQYAPGVTMAINF